MVLENILCGQRVHRLTAAALALFFLISTSSGMLIPVDGDVQAAVDGADPGDILVLKAGQYKPFTIDKSLTVLGVDGPVVRARIQTPAITVRADRVTISGLKVEGVPKDADAKFSYYMETSDRKSHYALDMPNVAILISCNDVTIEDSEIDGAEVGVQAEGAANITLWNDTFQNCDSGARLLDCRGGRIEASRFGECKKYGVYVEHSSEVSLVDNEAANISNAGMMLKESSCCLAKGNYFSGNWQGLVLWNSSFCELRGNEAYRNLYCGILITTSSNNTVIENLARETSRNEHTQSGMGIALLDNSSHNLVAMNTMEKNLNGLDIAKGCQFNLICGNDASDNCNGIRLDKNQNNLVYKNNFWRNRHANAYDNASHNFWNATAGNYYDDYRGRDDDGDGLGDDAYWIPKGSSYAVDWHPLIEPAGKDIDLVAAKNDLCVYAVYQPEKKLPYRVENRTIVIDSRPPTTWWLYVPIFTGSTMDRRVAMAESAAR
ncbi:MAG: right-handed parallel beta-helix repeat-containing protein [Methanotrichaceae archaeon]